jgi:hypothetical protein
MASLAGHGLDQEAWVDDLLARLDKLRGVVDLTEVFDEVSAELACCTEMVRVAE